MTNDTLSIDGSRILGTSTVPTLIVFLGAFAWALCAGSAIQFLLLPLMPGLHAGNGLVAGGDWVEFHRQAVLLAHRISEEGWQAWELRPNGNAPIGIATALYATTGIAEPWVVLPINCLLFGISAALLFAILSKITNDASVAAIAVVPFVVFPSAAVLYAQLHKDIISIAGFLTLVFVWTQMTAPRSVGWHKAFWLPLLVGIGCFLMWVVRPYLVPVMLAASLPVVVLLVVGTRRKTMSWWVGLVLATLTPAVMTMALGSPYVAEVVDVDQVASASPTTEVTVPASSSPGGALVPPPDPAGSTTQPATVSSSLPPPDPAGSTTQPATVSSSPAPSFLDRLVGELNAARTDFAEGYPEAGSNIDTSVRFDSMTDVLAYLPRALQIGLLAPFPSTWLDQAVSPGGNLMRLLSAVEMSLSYVLLAGLLLLPRYAGREAIVAGLVAVLASLGVIVVLSLVVTNVGTLYRMRFGAWQVMNGLGLVGWGLWLRQLHGERVRAAG